MPITIRTPNLSLELADITPEEWDGLLSQSLRKFSLRLSTSNPSFTLHVITSVFDRCLRLEDFCVWAPMQNTQSLRTVNINSSQRDWKDLPLVHLELPLLPADTTIDLMDGLPGTTIRGVEVNITRPISAYEPLFGRLFHALPAVTELYIAQIGFVEVTTTNDFLRRIYGVHTELAPIVSWLARRAGLFENLVKLVMFRPDWTWFAEEVTRAESRLNSLPCLEEFTLHLDEDPSKGDPGQELHPDIPVFCPSLRSLVLQGCGEAVDVGPLLAFVASLNPGPSFTRLELSEMVLISDLDDWRTEVFNAFKEAEFAQPGMRFTISHNGVDCLFDIDGLHFEAVDMGCW